MEVRKNTTGQLGICWITYRSIRSIRVADECSGGVYVGVYVILTSSGLTKYSIMLVVLTKN
jgi:hypothetical protein